MRYRIGVDTGGTFTDVALISEESGETFITKVPSTPENSSIGVLNGVKQIIMETGIQYEDLNFFIHGSTVATNTLLEKKGAKTVLLTTKGFKDVLQIGRQTRPKLYDFRARRNEPLVTRDLRLEIDERINAKGEVVKEIDQNQLTELVEKLKDVDAKAVVVSFINSFLNSENEIIVKEFLEKSLPNVSITISSEVLPEIKEYERTSTAVVNGYVMPKMEYYLRYLEEKITELKIPSELYIMQSNGGVINTDTTVKMPVRTVLSGPAGGVVGGSNIADQTEYKNLITIDMGGTSLDTSLIENGKPQYTTSSKIQDFPIHVPMVEMHTIGAGGGSIAWIDSGGALRVGPESAGAVPGPVCYGKGGTEPTVSDANAILGRINPNSLLGGKMKIDIHSAKKVIKEKIADPLGLTVEKAAEGILKVVNTNMVRGIRVISVEKGHDSRDFSLLAFGGAGPLHASDIAEELGCKNIIIPPNPGIACAMGMLTADVRHDYVQSYISELSQINLEELNNKLSKLYRISRDELAAEGFKKEEMKFQASLDLRYKNQAYNLNIELDDMYVTEVEIRNAVEKFHSSHNKVYGFSRLGEELEVANIRLISYGLIKKPKENINNNGPNQDLEPIGNREVYFEGSFYNTSIYERSDMYSGNVIKGPAVIEQLDSTVIIHPYQEALVDIYHNLVIQNVKKKAGRELKNAVLKN
ncbi:hydantoinase/oxoprolinase family protein [Oceanobacillus bengalensis]|uniref:Hydantoinase/oxoprolinase family protein n=1 Tax=Oceanobacillus bengalensis TaxID=1435466 RepID=A0A494YSN9_9BACI|nr:hydantoinase/oxoprolinase family protein [Oceanobacillus bengalensis]RKQ12952.1 hydantoinase/oxoprolinase family protein [Oceanobacillus bengalensis]